MVAIRYALARMALDAGEAEQTESHITVARGIASRRDPESYLTALVALQSWVCAHTGDTADAMRMLNVALNSLDKLPTPRRCQVMLKAARAHVVMGNRDEGLRLAAKAAGMAASRGLQLSNLEARLLLARESEDSYAAKGWLQEASNLGKKVAEGLDPESGKSFRIRYSELF